MPHILLGLASTLADPACGCLRLLPADGNAVTYRRLDDASWAPGGSGDPVRTAELVAEVQSGFGTAWQTAECLFADERVVYSLEGDAVQVSHEPLVPAAPAGAAPDVTTPAEVIQALGIPRSRRRPKLEQAEGFSRVVERAVAGSGRDELRLLDLACGRSYLGFVLAARLAAAGRRVRLLGVDSDAKLLGKCRSIAATLGWSHARFEQLDLARLSPERDAHDVAFALHACDTLTDEAIRAAWEGRCRWLFVAPCCQHELRHQWHGHDLAWVSRYGLLEQRLADTLTDAFRCLVLEALGYRVRAVRFVAAEVTPKNLLIQAELCAEPRPDLVAEAQAFMHRTGARLCLGRLLGEAL